VPGAGCRKTSDLSRLPGIGTLNQEPGTQFKNAKLSDV